MDMPGLSLFQGAESLKLNTSTLRLEEDEAREDQKRLDNELGNELQHAFEDLSDQDDTAASSVLYQSNHLLNPYPNQQLPPTYGNKFQAVNIQTHEKQPFERDKLCADIFQLRNALESKTREAQHATDTLLDERKKYDNQISDLKKRFALCEAEKERANMTRLQTHELLVESKGKISEQDDIILKLRAKIKTLENSNTDLVTEIENTKTMLSDAQHKYNMVERNAGFNASRKADAQLKDTNDRHAAQIDMMQQQIDTLRSKLHDSELEVKQIDARYREMQRSREALLVEKSETINQLSKAVENSQRQCQKLMAQGDLSQDNNRLKDTISIKQKQNEEMQKIINDLTKRLDATNSELRLLSSIAYDSTPNQMKKNKNFVESTPINSDERLSRLKNELQRCMNVQKEKREEIKKLEEQMVAKNEEIKRLKDDENNALVKMMNYKEESSRLSNRLKMVQNELEEMRRGNITNKPLINESKFHTIKEQNYSLQAEIDNVNRDYDNLKQDYDSLIKQNNQLLRSHDAIEEKNTKLLSENDDLRKNKTILNQSENETDKLELEKLKFLLNDSQKECDRVKNLYIELAGTKDQISRELAEVRSVDLHKELYVQKEKVASLERALQMSDIKCSELRKIMEKDKIEHEQQLHVMHEKYEKDKIENQKEMKNVSNNCSKCIDQMTEIAKYEIQNLQLQNCCTNYLKEINDLTKSLEDAKTTINDLQQKINLKEEHDSLIAELKEKAVKFEEYIRHQNNSQSTSPKRQHSRDKSVSTSPELDRVRDKSAQETEMKMREATAKIVAAKIKIAEDHFKEQIDKCEKNIGLLRNELDETQYHLQIRSREVHILKQAILAERATMTEILQKKDIETNNMCEKQNEMLRQCRNELETTQRKVNFLSKDIEQRREQFESERKSRDLVIAQWKEENKELKSEIEEIGLEKQKIIDQLNIKYQSIKKTAASYKKYAEDKDKHIAKENDRIKLAFDVAVKKTQEKMESARKNVLDR